MRALDVTVLFYAGLAYMAYTLLRCAIHIFGGLVRRNPKTGGLDWMGK